jgi:hypothetical protein
MNEAGRGRHPYQYLGCTHFFLRLERNPNMIPHIEGILKRGKSPYTKAQAPRRHVNPNLHLEGQER